MKTLGKLRLLLTVYLIMAVGLGSGAYAGADQDAVSLFVATDRHTSYETQKRDTKSSVSETEKKAPVPVFDASGNLIWHDHLTEVLTRVAEDEDAVQPEMVLLGGDFVGDGGPGGKDSTGYPIGTPYFAIEAVDAQIHSVFPAIRTGYTYGSHDQNIVSDYEDAFFTEPIKGNGYYLYSISFAQMVYDTQDQAKAPGRREKIYEGRDLADPRGECAQMASHHFLTWIHSLKDHLPVIVMSHVPLHADRGDNLGGWTWTRALNDAARDRDIVFLWGHNHTSMRKEEGKRIEDASCLIQPGEELTVQSWRSSGSEQEPATYRETILFTYLNAGYIKEGIGTLLTFSGRDENGQWTKLTAKRYAADEASGADQFGSTGIPSPWTLRLHDWSSGRQSH